MTECETGSIQCEFFMILQERLPFVLYFVDHAHSKYGSSDEHLYN